MLRFARTILYVRDMARARAFWEGAVGFVPAADAHADEHWIEYDTPGVRLCLHAGMNAAPGPDAPVVVLAAPDLNVAVARLGAAGAAFRPQRAAAPGVTIVEGHDPDGNPITLEHSAP